jgi:hypothetical protein
MFGSKREGVIGQWRKLHSEEVSYLCVSSNIFRLIKNKQMNWEGFVHYWGEERCVQGFCGEF